MPLRQSKGRSHVERRDLFFESCFSFPNFRFFSQNQMHFGHTTGLWSGWVGLRPRLKQVVVSFAQMRDSLRYLRSLTFGKLAAILREDDGVPAASALMRGRFDMSRGVGSVAFDVVVCGVASVREQRHNKCDTEPRCGSAVTHRRRGRAEYHVTRRERFDFLRRECTISCSREIG